MQDVFLTSFLIDRTTGKTVSIVEVYDTVNGGGGSGDMTKAIYDPNTIEADAFARANQTGSQAISTITSLQTNLDGKVNDTGNESIAGVKTFTDNLIISNLNDGDKGKYRLVADNSGNLIRQLNHEGQVKILTGNSVKPSFTPFPKEVEECITYASALGFEASPTTEWPQTIASPTDADIYDFVNDTFIENPIVGQITLWRIIINYTKNGDGDKPTIIVTLRNTISGFEERGFAQAPAKLGGILTGEVTFLLTTIADTASLPAPEGTGQGYEICVECFDKDLAFLEIDSVARISLYKNER